MRSASEYCKSLGLKSVADVSRKTRVDRVTLHRWFNSKPELFNVIVHGCLKLNELSRNP